MQWLTIPQIKRRSKTAKGALKVSYEHWNQLYTATAKELREAYAKNKVTIDHDYCGLCIYYENVCGIILTESELPQGPWKNKGIPKGIRESYSYKNRERTSLYNRKG